MGQQVGDPHHGAGLRTHGLNLRRGVVVRQPAADGGPGHAHPLRIDIDDQLPRHDAIAKGHHTRLAVQRARRDEARNQAGVQVADILQRRPDGCRRRLNGDLAMNGCHGCLRGNVSRQILCELKAPVTPYPDIFPGQPGHSEVKRGVIVRLNKKAASLVTDD